MGAKSAFGILDRTHADPPPKPGLAAARSRGHRTTLRLARIANEIRHLLALPRHAASFVCLVDCRIASALGSTPSTADYSHVSRPGTQGTKNGPLCRPGLAAVADRARSAARTDDTATAL